MGKHDSYGKNLFKQIVGSRFTSRGISVRVNYQGQVSAKIDGVIENSCAIEIESRTDKQIRGAILDLLYHPLSRKLLVIIPANMPRPEATVQHCKGILDSLKKPSDLVRVILLRGTGNDPDEKTDSAIIEEALREMGSI